MYSGATPRSVAMRSNHALGRLADELDDLRLGLCRIEQLDELRAADVVPFGDIVQERLYFGTLEVETWRGIGSCRIRSRGQQRHTHNQGHGQHGEDSECH
jgi:hypothetical protein